jgi:hypothetical protein
MAEGGVLRSAIETLREAVMPDRTSEASERARLLEKAVSRWESAPRVGSTPHRLKVDAATGMLGLVRSAGHLRSLCSAGATGDEPAGVGSTG